MMETHLRKGLAELELGDDAAPSLLRFGELLLEKNKVMNLTAITDPEDVVSLHFLDSAALLTLADLKDKTVVDVGTGAGFPGMPLKILEPSIRMTLLDSLGKRITLLTGGLRRAGITERAVCSRPGGGIRGRAPAEL
ncbi:MAG: 16S rRNA (guanine(527)-N(7))-methyltransferase RsmG [Dysosmobacter sp.]